MSDGGMCDPTENTLYKEPHDDHWGTFQDRLYECGKGPRKGIGIAVGGLVHVRSLKHWHSLESKLSACEAECLEQARLLGISGSKEAELMANLTNHTTIKNDAIAEVNRCHEKIRMYESIIQSTIYALEATEKYPKSVKELKSALSEGRDEG